MSEEERLPEHLKELWRELARQAIDKQWIPLAVLGGVRHGEVFHGAIARERSLKKETLLSVLKQIVAELEREEQGNGQRVS